MTKGAKLWLYIALVICVFTTILNATEGRVISVVIALVSLCGLILLLFKEKKSGFYIMCGSNAVSCIYSIVTSINQPAAQNVNIAVYIAMSIIGAMMIPFLTFLFIRKSFHYLH